MIKLVFFVKYIYPLLLRKINLSLKFKNYNSMIKVGSSKFYPGYYQSLNRSVRYSFEGLLYVGEWLYKKYLIDKVKINSNDTIIEIGTNLCKLTYYLKKFKSFMHVIEMDKKLISCLRLNLKIIKTNTRHCNLE